MSQSRPWACLSVPGSSFPATHHCHFPASCLLHCCIAAAYASHSFISLSIALFSSLRRHLFFSDIPTFFFFGVDAQPTVKTRSLPANRSLEPQDTSESKPTQPASRPSVSNATALWAEQERLDENPWS